MIYSRTHESRHTDCESLAKVRAECDFSARGRWSADHSLAEGCTAGSWPARVWRSSGARRARRGRPVGRGRRRARPSRSRQGSRAAARARTGADGRVSRTCHRVCVTASEKTGLAAGTRAVGRGGACAAACALRHLRGRAGRGEGRASWGDAARWLSLHGWDMPTRGLSDEPGHSQQASDADNGGVRAVLWF